MTVTKTRTPVYEHTVPWFWPMAAVIEFEQEGLEMLQDNMRYIQEAVKMEAPPPPEWATPNLVRMELDTMRLRDFLSDVSTHRTDFAV
jgi:poly(3-hydroxybutyrate) depolymerase